MIVWKGKGLEEQDKAEQLEYLSWLKAPPFFFCYPLFSPLLTYSSFCLWLSFSHYTLSKTHRFDFFQCFFKRGINKKYIS